jgi:hypothetical protein
MASSLHLLLAISTYFLPKRSGKELYTNSESTNNHAVCRQKSVNEHVLWVNAISTYAPLVTTAYRDQGAL